MKFAEGVITFALPQCCFFEDAYLRILRLKNRKGITMKNWLRTEKFLSIFQNTLSISFLPKAEHKAFYGYVVIDELSRLAEREHGSKCSKCGRDHTAVGHQIFETISGQTV